MSSAGAKTQADPIERGFHPVVYQHSGCLFGATLMDQQANRVRSPLGEALRLPYVAGLLFLLAILVAFQFLQIYRYREVVIRNDTNAHLLAQALEQLARVDAVSNDLKKFEVMSDSLKKSFESASNSLKRSFEAASDGQETKFDATSETMKADSEELKRLYLVWKKQLNEIAVSESVLKAGMEDMKRSQEADRTKLALFDAFSPKYTYGQNVFVGHNAGNSLKNHTVAEGDDPNIASFNAALGEDALAANQQGHSNTAIGADALTTNNDGFFNVATGRQALASNTSGSGNVAVGAAAMYRNSSGRHNSAVGLQALYRLEEGHDNSAFGRDSMFSATKGSWNSAFGVDSLPGLGSGEGNSAFGGEAGYTEEPSNQIKTGSFNSWFGYQSGPGSLKQISNSVAIGYRAKNTDSNQTVIGNRGTAETIIFGNVKVDAICVGSTCADAETFRVLLDSVRRKN
jgi:hypothetical protein